MSLKSYTAGSALERNDVPFRCEVRVAKVDSLLPAHAKSQRYNYEDTTLPVIHAKSTHPAASHRGISL
jgi:hypothetical protein